jgi:hypothetical protein
MLKLNYVAGLNGSNGVQPARSQLESKGKTLLDKILSKPTLVWLAPYIGLNTEYMLDLIALVGVFLAFTGYDIINHSTDDDDRDFLFVFFNIFESRKKKKKK